MIDVSGYSKSLADVGGYLISVEFSGIIKSVESSGFLKYGVDINKALVLKKHTNPAAKVLLKYYKYLIIFSWKETNKLAERQLYNYKIIIKEGKYFRFGFLYRIS